MNIIYDFNVKVGFKILFYFSSIACKRLNNYHYNNFTQRLFNFMFLDIILYVIYYTHIEIFMFYFKKYENIKKNKKNEKKKYNYNFK